MLTSLNYKYVDLSNKWIKVAKINNIFDMENYGVKVLLVPIIIGTYFLAQMLF